MNLQQLSNEELIAACKKIPVAGVSDLHHMIELLTRFERLSLGKQADDACKKAEELQQPTLQVGWEYKNGHGQWIPIVNKTTRPNHPFEDNGGKSYASNGRYDVTLPPCLLDLDLSTGRPVKKVQVDDEVEALARELFLREASIDRIDYFKSYYDLAEQFINHRNERRGKK